MSRRHKTPEELERIQSRQRGSQGDSSLKVTSSHSGSASNYLMKDHIGEKIPSMSTIQKGIKWFWGWRREVLAWRDKAREEREHSVWERLYRLIMGELPRLEPRLAVC